VLKRRIQEENLRIQGGMNVPELGIAPATLDESDVVARTAGDANEQAQWKARYELAWHRAETERLRVLVDFLGRPVHAHGGPEPDPDIVTAYNLAVESALREIRRAALDGD
jgi:hypothetical protein